MNYFDDYFGRTNGDGVAVEHYGTDTNLGVRAYADEFPSTYERDVALHTEGRVEVFPLGQSEVAQGNVVAMPQTEVFKPAAQPMPKAQNGVMVRPGVEVYGIGNVPVTQEYQSYQGYQAQSVGAYREPLVIYFDYNSSHLDSVDFAQVADFAATYRGGGMPRISVEGHASPESDYGQNVGNMKVSLDRANAVAKALVESGISSDSITVQAFGAKRRAPSFLNKGENADRRVEVHVR